MGANKVPCKPNTDSNSTEEVFSVPYDQNWEELVIPTVLESFQSIW